MPTQSSDPLINQLRTLAQSSPELKPAAQIYEIILPILRDANLRVTPIEMPGLGAHEKLGRGIPLLRDENLSVDPNATRELLMQLTRALEKTPRGAEAKPIRTAFERNKIDVAALWLHLVQNDHAYVDALAQELKLDPGFFWTLAQNAVKAAYRAWAQQLGPLPPQTDWESANCFVCGDIAMLAELQGNDQERHLRCGRCGADWKYRRLKCIYCGNENPKTLGTLYEDATRNKMSAQTCDNCHGYIKMIAAFSPNPPEMLIVQDLVSLPLDFIAQQNGYAHGIII